MTHETPSPSARINFAKAAPRAFKALIGFDAAAREGREPHRRQYREGARHRRAGVPSMTAGAAGEARTA